MKRHLLGILIVVVFSVCLGAENKGNISITYDYSKNEIKDDNNSMFSIWYGKNLTFNVTNINPFLYKVVINGSGLNYYQNEVPKNFSDLTTKVFETSVEVTKIEDMIKTAAVKSKAEMTPLEMKMAAHEKNPDLMPVDTKIITSGSSFIFNCYQSFHNRLFQNKSCSGIINDIVTSFKELRKNFHQDDPASDPEQFTTDDIPRELTRVNNQIDEQVKEISRKIGDNAELKKEIEKLKGLVDLNFEMIVAINKANSKLNEANFVKSIVFPTVDVDHFQVTVKVDPISNEVEVPYQVIDPIVIKVKRGWKIDFSTGMQFIMNAEPQSYLLEKVDADPTKVLIKKAYDRFSIKPTANVLMHVYVRSRRSLKWGGILFGFGTNDAKEISYFLGSGLMFGTKNRFIMNCGLALQRISTLKPQYEVGQILISDPEITPESLLFDSLKPRYFFGVSYNLSK